MWYSYTGENHHKDVQRQTIAGGQFCKICKRWRIKKKTPIEKERNTVIIPSWYTLSVSWIQCYLQCRERLVLHNCHTLHTAIWIHKGNRRPSGEAISAVGVFLLEYWTAATICTSLDEPFYDVPVHWDRCYEFSHGVLTEPAADSISQSEAGRCWKICCRVSSKNHRPSCSHKRTGWWALCNDWEDPYRSLSGKRSTILDG